MAAELGRTETSLQRTFFSNDKNIVLGRIHVKKFKNIVENIFTPETAFNLLVSNYSHRKLKTGKLDLIIIVKEQNYES